LGDFSGSRRSVDKPKRNILEQISVGPYSGDEVKGGCFMLNKEDLKFTSTNNRKERGQAPPYYD